MSKFTIIGENIHATRVLRLNGKRVGPNENGVESVIYKGWVDVDGISSGTPIMENVTITYFPIKCSLFLICLKISIIS